MDRFGRVGAKGRMLRGVCLAGFAWAVAHPALAQDSAQAEEEIIVTGSRIRQPDFQSSNPVVSVDAEAIQLSGTTNLTDFLQQLPALTNSIDSNDAASINAGIAGSGLNLLNLRNLGTDRTLVLVDGRRHVSSDPGSAAVDVNTIPIDLIERVEVLTGGASAIYGADGVSGVVNFIMRDDFEGMTARAQYGSPEEEGGGQSTFLGVTAGSNFAADRGNFTVSLEYSNDRKLSLYDREFSGLRGVGFRENPGFADINGDGVPEVTPPFTQIPLGDIRYFDSAVGGAVYAQLDDYNALFGIDPAAILDLDFVGDGTPWDPGIFVPPIFQQGGTATPIASYNGDPIQGLERFAVNAGGRYDMTPNLRVFTQLKYVVTESESTSQPTFDFFLAIDPATNPYVPDVIRQTALSTGAPLIFVSRDNFDLGVRGERIKRETYRGVWGVEGSLFGDAVDYEASYTYGRTDVDARILNNRYNDRLSQALDAVIDPATGRIVCAIDLDPTYFSNNEFIQGFPAPTSFTPGANSGCVPVNIFGENSVSAEARNWIMTTSRESASVRQHVVNAFLTGDSERLFSLPGGPIGWVIGGEWRREESESTPPPEDTAGLTFGNVRFPTAGSFEVREAFVELQAPILEGVFLAEELRLDGAARISDYTTIGQTTTWKVGLEYAPVRDITFRGTLAQAVRAPNIAELFRPAGQTFELINDPCSQANLNLGTQFRQANCAAILSALGVDPTTFIDPNSSSVGGTLQGNSALEEEEADTQTMGVVVRPRFIPNLTFSVDYYDIEISNAVNTALGEELAELCVDAPNINNQFCKFVSRDPATGGIDNFTQQPFNVASFNTKGYDFSANYLFDPANWGVDGDWGLLNIRLIGNYLEELSFINVPNAPRDFDEGEGGPDEATPEWQFALDLTWQRGPLTLNYGWSWHDETRRFDAEEVAGDPAIAAPEYLYYDARSVHDFQARYDFSSVWSVYAGVNNFTDQEPDIGEVAYPVNPLGRFWYVGVRTNLPSLRRN
ncbi:MAG: TonB-dependent receptor plug domain-containing protein [Alphaproteobacteria bacterium]|nr:TonB-dependent receptor plug domain-containing protein [Alphaproteobacteria bacterium]